MEKRRTQNLHFWSSYDHPFPSEDDRNRKRQAVVGKTLSHWAIQICQNQDYISSHLSGKSTIIFFNIWALFARKQGRVTNQRVRIKIWQNFVNLWKHFGSNIFQFCSYKSQSTFQKNFNWIFKFSCFSWYHA